MTFSLRFSLRLSCEQLFGLHHLILFSHAGVFLRIVFNHTDFYTDLQWDLKSIFFTSRPSKEIAGEDMAILVL